ncbi:Transposase [Aquiflexum balticum DSM 16537]|uniref:Transposase n=1 Tax=Aquiflexum balticum DSM 16537 TaxID=758820 RepID=A0A1W2HBC4_9BACT|nr:IS1634 family transposase [Aquiflexum balticum]SMD41960.1 Transposase [Aquiflexum balticum DSM 16537]SMD45906.1 Transposase [Aquiflexum balticum DSM 16537]
MFVRKKPNKSGLVSVQVIDKSQGKYKVLKTIGSSKDTLEIERLVAEGKSYAQKQMGLQEIDFTDHRRIFTDVLSSISSHKLVGIQYVLGKIFDDIGFTQINEELFKDLVLYRLVYPKSKLKTTEYLYRYEQKSYSEDDIYRFMDRLHSRYKDLVQKISFEHTLQVLDGGIHAVFYDVTTIYFEIEKEDDIRKPGFSKDGKHKHPQIVLGLLVSKDAYPLAYDIFEGNKYEGDTFLPILEGFRMKYNFEKLTVVADAGLLSNKNVQELVEKGYEFILGARIKNEKESVKKEILGLDFEKDQSRAIKKEGMTLVVTYSQDRAKKDRYNRERGVKRLEMQLKSGKLTKSSINNKGYNKFLRMEGEVALALDQEKVDMDAKWDGLKGYLTNSTMTKEEVLENYRHLWQIEKAFRVAKNELKIRPVFHHKRERIEAHICLNFTAYKVYKELDRILKSKKAGLSPEKAIEIIQNIHEIGLVTPNKEVIKKTIILTEEQKSVQEIFGF